MRLDGWQRFEREAGRLDLENGLLKGQLQAAEERNRELSGFLESAGTPARAPLSPESDVVPGPEYIPPIGVVLEPVDSPKISPDAAAIIAEARSMGWADGTPKSDSETD